MRCRPPRWPRPSHVAATLGVLTTHRNSEFATPVTLWRSSVERWPQGRARILYAECAGPKREITNRPSTSCNWRCATSRRRGRCWGASSRRQGGMTRRCASFRRSSPPSRVPRIRCRPGCCSPDIFDRHRPLRRGRPPSFVGSSNCFPRTLFRANVSPASWSPMGMPRRLPCSTASCCVKLRTTPCWQARLARALALSGRFDEAAAAYRQALRVDAAYRRGADGAGRGVVRDRAHRRGGGARGGCARARAPRRTVTQHPRCRPRDRGTPRRSDRTLQAGDRHRSRLHGSPQ